jgi:hypothetical protein
MTRLKWQSNLRVEIALMSLDKKTAWVQAAFSSLNSVPAKNIWHCREPD